MKNSKILWSVVFVISILMVMIPTKSIAAQNQRVTVAYIDYNSFIEKNKDGSYTGYGVDYLNQIADDTGWDFEYVDMDWTSAYEAVKKGDVDFYCVARMTEEREPYFDFSMYPLIDEEVNLYTLANNEIYFNDYETLNGKCIGVLKNSSEKDFFTDYASHNSITYELQEFDTNEAVCEALETGLVNAAVLVNYSAKEKYQIAANLGVAPAYLMSTNGSSRMREFSKAQEKLYFKNEGFLDGLKKRYYTKDTTKSKLLFTREEAEFIANTDVLEVSATSSMGPIEYFDSSAGTFRGVSIDVFQKITDMTGMSFHFIERKPGPEYQKKMKNGEIQIIGAMAKSPILEQELPIKQTDSFSESTFTEVAKDFGKITPDSIVAVPKDYPMYSEIAKQYGFHNIKEYSTIEECLDAVILDQASLTYIVSMCEDYLLGHAKYSGLKTMILRNTESRVCFGVTDQCSPALLSILNKCINAIPSQEIDMMYVRNTSLAKSGMNMWDLLVKYNWLVMIIITFTLIGILIFIVHRQQVREQIAVLRATEKQHEILQHLYDTVPCGIFQYSHEEPHKILNNNATAAEIYGYDSDASFEGSLPRNVVKADSEADFLVKFKECSESNNPIHYLWTITKKDGSEAVVECVMDEVDLGGILVFREIFIDVTERVIIEKQIEKRYLLEMERKEKKKDGLLYTSCFDIDEQKLINTNIDIPGLEAGIPMDDFFDRLMPELSDQQTEEELREHRMHFSEERTKAAYERGNYEFSFSLCRRREGKLQWLRSDLALRRDPSTGHLLCFDYVWDVTDKHVTGEIIRKLALADCDGFMCIDGTNGYCMQYRITEDGSLERYTAQYGVDDSIHRIQEEMIVRNQEEIWHRVTLEEVEKQLQSKEYDQVSIVLHDEKGNRFDKLLSFFYIDRGLELIAVAVSDVTQVRKDEVRHAELLSAALAEAEKADAAKSQFLSSVSHEMRTPLNAIIGFMELAKGADAEKVQNCLASANIAARQLLAVINDVLDMSSIESGKMKIAKSPFDFKHLLSSIVNIYGTQCKQKGLAFEVRMKSVSEDWLVGDELRVNQILMNLLGNSMKFTSQGHIWLTISQTSVAESKIFMRFEVTDSGCGMSEELMSRLFRPFEQENASTARKYGGSGLGLSIVKNLVNMMEGSIRVESELNQGTTFTVDLPFEKYTVDKQKMLSEDIERFHILAVDDEEVERQYLDHVLSNIGVRHRCVSSGVDALCEIERARNENDQYSLCLIDWNMPEMNGKEVAEKIREKFGRDLMIIVISAYDFQQTDDDWKDGADIFLPKPIFPSSLFDLFMSLTNGRIAAPKEQITSWDFAGKRVLLAEDNVLNQIVAQGYLSKYNVVVDIAENGQSAVDMFTASEKGYYDAILMDIQMPVLDGFEATKEIRASSHPEAVTIPIIAQTADAFNEDISKALSSGMNYHVAKPIQPDTLAATLAKAFSRSK